MVFDICHILIFCIPEEILVQMDEMEESLNIGELSLPDTVKAVASPETVVCHIVIKAEEETTTSEAEGEEGETSDAGEAEKSDGSDG